jgi:hypothetical protein
MNNGFLNIFLHFLNEINSFKIVIIKYMNEYIVQEENIVRLGISSQFVR